MSTSVTLNGVSYSIPAVGEDSWGTAVSTYLIALSTGVLSKAAGAFTLTAEADFGATYGLKAAYFKSRGTVSTVGIVRLANDESISWRNAANNANLSLKANSSGILEFNGNPISALALGTADTVLKMNSAGTATEYGFLTDDNIDAAAGIVYSKLSLSDSIVNADINSAAAIARSKIATGSNDHVVINGAGGALSSEAQLDITRGGTGQSTANAALNALLPSQTSQNGKILGTDGINTSWVSPFTNPMTTTGDIVYSSDGSGTPARLGIGASSTVLKGGTIPAWGQIANAQIDNAAAIAGTKISPDFGSQNIITTGTGSSLSGLILTKSGASDQLQLTRTTSNAGTVYVGTLGGDLRIGSTGGGVDLLRVTTTTLQLGFAGSAGTPAYSWANDTDTGIYNNGDNTVRIATAGALAALFQDVSTSAAEALGIYKTPNDNTTANRFLRFYINAGGTNSGGIVANGANTAAFAVISDARTKENIIELGDELSKIRALRPVEFDYIDGSGHQVGFIAQEMETVYPEYVAADENGFLNIAGWANKDAQMVKAMQQMADLIDTLTQRVADLEAMI